MEMIWEGVEPGEDDKRDRCFSYWLDVLGNNICTRPFAVEGIEVRIWWIMPKVPIYTASDLSYHNMRFTLRGYKYLMLLPSRHWNMSQTARKSLAWTSYSKQYAWKGMQQDCRFLRIRNLSGKSNETESRLTPPSDRTAWSSLNYLRSKMAQPEK